MLKTHPHQSLIRKLFASVATSPFLVAPQYGIRTKSNLTSVLKDFTLASFLTKNPISLVFEVLYPNAWFSRLLGHFYCTTTTA